MKILIYFLLCLIPLPAFAGGTSWSFEIKNFQNISDEHAIIFLKCLEEEKHCPFSCNSLTVDLRYEPEHWPMKTWSGKLVTEESQRQAINFLLDAYRSKRPVRFGSFGYGLTPNNGNEVCSFKSRGLAILGESSGVKAVYSFHNPI